jgi:hypothetical protein
MNGTGQAVSEAAERDAVELARQDALNLVRQRAADLLDDLQHQLDESRRVLSEGDAALASALVVRPVGRGPRWPDAAPRPCCTRPPPLGGCGPGLAGQRPRPF